MQTKGAWETEENTTVEEPDGASQKEILVWSGSSLILLNDLTSDERLRLNDYFTDPAWAGFLFRESLA